MLAGNALTLSVTLVAEGDPFSRERTWDGQGWGGRDAPARWEGLLMRWEGQAPASGERRCCLASGRGISALWRINPGQERTLQADGAERMLAFCPQEMVAGSQSRH